MQLTNFDFILIFLYFAVLLIIGYFTSRKQKQEDYLIAERKLGTWSTMATINASKTGSILMIFVALVYLWGIAAIWYFIGMVLGVLIFLPFALKLKENSTEKFYTLSHYFKYNYGKKAAFFASLITIFLMIGYLILNLIAGTKIFTFFTGWPFWLCAIIMIIVVLLYLLMGGFRAVVRTDFIQYIAMLLILVLLALTIFNGSLIPASEWNLFQTDILTMFGFFLVGLLFPFAMPDMWQRVYASKNKKTLKKGILFSALVYFIFAFLLALIALTVKVAYPEIDPDLALLYGFANLLPQGFLGLAIVLLFAAVMSSIDTYIFTGASSIIQDFSDWSRQETIKNIKKVIFILAVFGTAISILLQSLVIGSYIFVASLTILAVIVIATWIKKDIKPRTLVFGFVFGIIGYIIYLVKTINNVSPTIVVIALISTLLGLFIGAIVTFLRKRV
jgi:SSS family solute:Na+ symporter